MLSQSNSRVHSIRADWDPLCNKVKALRRDFNEECLRETDAIKAEYSRHLAQAKAVVKVLSGILENCATRAWFKSWAKLALKVSRGDEKIGQIEREMRNPTAIPRWKRIMRKLVEDSAGRNYRPAKPRQRLEYWKRQAVETSSAIRDYVAPLFHELRSLQRQMVAAESAGTVDWRNGEHKNIRALVEEAAGVEVGNLGEVLAFFERHAKQSGRQLRELKKALPLYLQALERGCEVTQKKRLHNCIAALAKTNGAKLDRVLAAEIDAEQRIGGPQDLVFAYLFFSKEVGDAEAANGYAARFRALPEKIAIKTLDKLLAQQLISAADADALRVASRDERVSPEQAQAEIQRKLVERAEAKEALIPFVPDEAQRHRLALSVTVTTVNDSRTLLASALISPELADELLCTNPALFQLHQEEPEAFLDYVTRLEDVRPAIALLIRDGLYRPVNFASPAALERSISEAYAEVSAAEKKEEFKAVLATCGLDPEVAFAVLHYGFHYGKYYINSSLIPEEHVRTNVRRRMAQSAAIESKIHSQLAKLVRWGAVVELRQCYGLNVKVEGPLKEAVLWVLENPPRKEKSG